MKKFFRIAVPLAAGLVTLCFMVYYFFPGTMLKMITGLSYKVAGIEERSVKVNSLTWSYLIGGEGEETIVWIHGLGDKNNFSDFVANFTGQYRVILPDLPGFGESTAAITLSYDNKSQVERLHGFISAMKLCSFHLVGHAYGGGVAALYASRYPDQVKSLFLMTPSGIDTGRGDDTTTVLQRLDSKGNNFMYMRTVDDIDAFLDFFFYSPPEIPGRVKQYLVEENIKRYETMMKIYNDIRADGFNFLRNKLGSITSPVLVMWGKDDTFASPVAAEVYKKSIKNSQIILLDRCKHVPYSDRKDESIKLYREFLIQVSNRDL